jgi:TolA-binding protein
LSAAIGVNANGFEGRSRDQVATMISESVEAAQNQMSSDGYVPWKWVAGALGVAFSALSTVIVLFWRMLESRNAKDIKALTELCERLQKENEAETKALKDQCERLQKELDTVNGKLTILMLTNQRLESEKAAAEKSAEEHKLLYDQYRREHGG